MTGIDIGILILLGFGAYQGFKTGLLMQLLGIIGFFLSIIGGFHLMYWGADMLSEFIHGYENILPFIAFFVIFIFIVVVINLTGKALKSLLDMTLLGSFDNIVGAIAGVLKWALFLSLMTWVVETFAPFPLGQFGEGSVLYPIIASFAPFLLDVFSGWLPVFQELIKNKPDFPQT
ncbi:MAG: CvpA family protein [Bacteroidetes bacterium]|nr:CvpA family protein [Bacteroidota bacterium]MDA1119264.1 CvpA family protein [Bacteroidota bacterium]